MRTVSSAYHDPSINNLPALIKASNELIDINKDIAAVNISVRKNLKEFGDILDSDIKNNLIKLEAKALNAVLH